MPEAAYGTTNAWLTCIVVDPDAFGADREAIRLALEAEDIEARPALEADAPAAGLRAHRMFGGDVSARLFERGLCLPSGSALTEDDQDRVDRDRLSLGTALAPDSRRVRPAPDTDRGSAFADGQSRHVSTTSSQWLHASLRPLTMSR